MVASRIGRTVIVITAPTNTPNADIWPSSWRGGESTKESESKPTIEVIALMITGGELLLAAVFADAMILAVDPDSSHRR